MKTRLFKKRRPVALVTLIYVFLGSMWILFSDRLVFYLFEDPLILTRVQTWKGWFYVGASGLLIYFLLSWVVEELKKREKHIRDVELLRKQFLEQHNHPIWIADREAKCIFSNQKWFALTGSSIDSSKPFAWMERVHPNDKPRCIETFTRGFLKKNAFELEYRLRTKSDEYHWVLNTCSPQKDLNGNFNGFAGFIQDIQEKKRLEEQYKESSRRYGSLFASNPNPMFVYDTQDFRILEANKAAFHLYGYEEQEFLSMTIIDLRPASEIPALMEHISEALPEYHRSSGWVHKKKDGTLFDVEVTGHSFPVKHSRSLRIVLVRDITEQIKAFRTAKEGERRFESIFLNSPYGALICSKSLDITDVNPVACRLLDYDREKLLELSLKDLFSSQIEEGNDENYPFSITQVSSGKVHWSGECHLLRKNGREFRADYSAIRFIEKGEYKLYFTFNDIDANYKMQIALKESERINSALVTNLPGMVYRCLHDEHWTMIYVSHGVEKLTGYKSRDLLYNNVVSYNSIIHPEDRGKTYDTVLKALEKKKKFNIQYRIITGNGAEKWVWEQARGIYNDEGLLEYIEGFIMDVTREKQALEQVEFQSYFLGLIIDNIPFPLFYKDVNGVYGNCNKVFCEMLGREKKDIVGHTVFDIFEPGQAGVFFEKDKELMEQGGKQVYETEITFPDGRKMDALFHKSVFYDMNNVPMGIIGVYFDITQRVKDERVIKQQLEELGRINSELERFSYTVSHDLRSPLVTIKGFVGLLREDLQDNNEQQIREDILRIENATDKMQQLLEDLLKLSRVGKVVDQYEEFSMTDPAREAHELLFGMLKNNTCKVEIQKNMPLVHAGKARIRELFQNLIENAVKFSMSTAEPLIKVYVRNDNGENVFCVEDNGIGVEKKYHDKIFGLFNKLDNNTPGTGLGLSLVKRIVDNYNGRVWIESDGMNQGTIVCFTVNTEKQSDKID